MRRLAFPLLALFTAVSAFAAGPAPRPTEKLWPGRAPGETKELPPEADLTKPTDDLIAGRRIIKLGNVSDPTITIYRPDPAKDTGAAVLVCPGGGYYILAMDLEGTEVCAWLNSIGVTGVLLKYRVPAREGQPRHLAPLQDAQRALGLVRHRAAELGLDPHRIGVLGFSAGGHLAAELSNHHDERIYPAVDDADRTSCRPDFAVLVYPGYLAVKEKGDALAEDLPVSATNTPPTFLVMAEDDPVRVENALVYYAALKNAQVPAELHVYPQGGHGYGLRRTANPVTAWPDRVEDWMRAAGWLTQARS
jgi:acetyl esterase/lipase